MKRSSARAAGRKSVAGPHHRLNILSLPGRYALSPLVHLSSLLMLALPVCRHPFLTLSLPQESQHPLSLRLPISARFPFFSPLFLPSSLPASPRLSCPSFLLARLTKMGPAASGSRFPRKLSSYKINYPPYFIAPRRSGVRVDVSARSPSFFSRFLFPRRRDEFLTNWIALRTEMRIPVLSWSRPFSSRSSGNDSPEKWRSKIEKAEHDPLSQINERKDSRQKWRFI